MFALEISFEDGVSEPEMIYVRRPQALIGALDYAHVVVEDMKGLSFQLRLVRDVGRRFRCKPIALSREAAVPVSLEGTYENEAVLDLGVVRFLVTTLDSDLLLREGEPPDRAGVRILRQASARPEPMYPAVVVTGSPPIVVSFSVDQSIFIGRSKHCALRLDSADISARHARLGFDKENFWIEDLGSTNGTFVAGQQISGRTMVAPGEAIVLGRELTIIGVTSEEHMAAVLSGPVEAEVKSAPSEQHYPVLLSVSEVARPARLVVSPEASITIGRDPNCDMWLGAPHISRHHCTVSLMSSGVLRVVDSSTNGTAYDAGILHKGEVLELTSEPRVLNFGGTVTVAICFNESQEEEFVAAQGAVMVFCEGLAKTGVFNVNPIDIPGLSPQSGSDGFGKIGLNMLSKAVAFYRHLSPGSRLVAVTILVTLAVVVGAMAMLILPKF